MKILIVGASGFLGTKLLSIFSKEHKVIGADLNHKNPDFKIDATNFSEINSFLLKYKPDLVIDTVALTSSLTCEKNPELAFKLNYITAKNIAKVCTKLNCFLVFISSSYVFDGKKGDYKEEDNPNPLNEYGRTKIIAEKEILFYKKGIVLRVDIMYGFNGMKERNGIFSKILSREKIEISNSEQIRQPLLVDDVSETIISLIKNKKRGLFHLAGTTRLSMYEFLKNLEKIIRKQSKIFIVNKKLEVNHPRNATLNITKIKKLGIKTHSFKEGIEIIRKQISSQSSNY